MAITFICVPHFKITARAHGLRTRRRDRFFLVYRVHPNELFVCLSFYFIFRCHRTGGRGTSLLDVSIENTFLTFLSLYFINILKLPFHTEYT